jgi:hypothetical protein
MILGNLLRMKGQVARSIHIHQSLLQRPDLTPIEHAYVLLCLGLDFRHGGFVDRAVGAFQDVLRLDPSEPLRAREPAEASRGAASMGRGCAAFESASSISPPATVWPIGGSSGSCTTRWASPQPAETPPRRPPPSIARSTRIRSPPRPI